MSVDLIPNFLPTNPIVDLPLITKKIAQASRQPNPPREGGLPTQMRTEVMDMGGQSNAVNMLLEYAESKKRNGATGTEPPASSAEATPEAETAPEGAEGWTVISEAPPETDTQPQEDVGWTVISEAPTGTEIPTEEDADWTVLSSLPQIQDEDEVTVIEQVYDDGTVVEITIKQDEDGLNDSDGDQMDILSVKIAHNSGYNAGRSTIWTHDPSTDTWSSNIRPSMKLDPEKYPLDENGNMLPTFDQGSGLVFLDQNFISTNPDLVANTPIMFGNGIPTVTQSNMHMMGYETPKTIRDPLKSVMPNYAKNPVPPVVEQVEGFDTGNPDQMTFRVTLPGDDLVPPKTVFVHIDRSAVANSGRSEDSSAEHLAMGVAQDLSRLHPSSLGAMGQSSIVLTDLPDGQDVQYDPSGEIILDADEPWLFGTETMSGHDVLNGAIGGMFFDQNFDAPLTLDWLDAMEEDSQRAGASGISVSEEASQDPQADIRETFLIWHGIKTGRITGNAKAYFNEAFKSRFAILDSMGVPTTFGISTSTLGGAPTTGKIDMTMVNPGRGRG